MVIPSATDRLNSPLTSVMVPVVVPLITTFAPIIGLFCESTTLPVMVRMGDPAMVSRIKLMNRTIVFMVFNFKMKVVFQLGASGKRIP